MASAEQPHIVLTPTQQEGRTIYQTVCWTCHGTSGRGDGPAVQAGTMSAPPSFHTEEYATASVTDLERRFGMDIDAADPNHPHMQYVASLLQPEKFHAALAFIPALAYPAELPGSALAGETIFNYRCAACHGRDGRGDGPAADALVAAKPADFTQDTLLARRDWAAVSTRIHEGGQKVHGSSMPPWGIVLSEDEIQDLIAYLGTFQPAILSSPPWAATH
jgi:mono/diheme cytochrome c family protein